MAEFIHTFIHTYFILEWLKWWLRWARFLTSTITTIWRVMIKKRNVFVYHYIKLRESLKSKRSQTLSMRVKAEPDVTRAFPVKSEIACGALCRSEWRHLPGKFSSRFLQAHSACFYPSSLSLQTSASPVCGTSLWKHHRECHSFRFPHCITYDFTSRQNCVAITGVTMQSTFLSREKWKRKEWKSGK